MSFNPHIWVCVCGGGGGGGGEWREGKRHFGNTSGWLDNHSLQILSSINDQIVRNPGSDLLHHNDWCSKQSQMRI